MSKQGTPRLGRPPAAPDGVARRSRNVTFSDAEWEWLRKRAERAGVSIAEWIRRRALRGMRTD